MTTASKSELETRKERASSPSSHFKPVYLGVQVGILVNPLILVRRETALRSVSAMLPGHLSEHTVLAILGLSLVTAGFLVRLYYARQKKRSKISAPIHHPEGRVPASPSHTHKGSSLVGKAS